MSAHLSPDEILERVFPEEGGPAAVPAHLSACAHCQERVARLREAWLLDRGAVAGVVDDLPPDFWTEQAARAMKAVRAEAGVPSTPARRGLRRHPVLALSSLAAALLLAATILVGRIPTAAPRTAAVERPTAASGDASDEELLRAIDRVLDDSSLAHVAPEDVL